MHIIYETKGKAREYTELATNLYTTCEHGCLYCYCPAILHVKPEEFFVKGKPKKDVLELIEKDAVELEAKGETRRIQLSFIGDPYQPAETEYLITRSTIKILHQHGLRVTILTKNGLRAVGDFDLLTLADLFGVSLTCMLPETISKWEPGISDWYSRITALKEAKKRGIPTWVSFEPVLNPPETLALIEQAAPYADFMAVGTLNYRREADYIDWHQFAIDVIDKLQKTGKCFYIKQDLLKEIKDSPKEWNSGWLRGTSIIKSPPDIQLLNEIWRGPFYPAGDLIKGDRI
jgi:DNA repair photolyase